MKHKLLFKAESQNVVQYPRPRWMLAILSAPLIFPYIICLHFPHMDKDTGLNISSHNVAVNIKIDSNEFSLKEKAGTKPKILTNYPP